LKQKICFPYYCHQIVFAMKKINYPMLLCLLATTFYFSSRQWTWSNSSGGPASRTGAPTAGGGNEATCQGCHGGSINQGTNLLNLTIAGNPQVFEPSTTYDLTASFSSPGAGGHGFQVVALNPQLASTGTFIPGTGSKLVSGSGRTYITHNNPNSTSWTFQWTSPATLPASVNFYAVTANRGGGPSRAFTISKTITNTPTSVSGVNEKESINLFPFNVDKEVFISSGNVNNPLMAWMVTDQMGRIVAQSEKAAMHESERIELPSGLQSGVYMVQIHTPGGRTVKRFFKN
jgi:hypothetical protein